MILVRWCQDGDSGYRFFGEEKIILGLVALEWLKIGGSDCFCLGLTRFCEMLVRFFFGFSL